MKCGMGIQRGRSCAHHQGGKDQQGHINIMVNTNADIQIMEEVQAFKDMV